MALAAIGSGTSITYRDRTGNSGTPRIVTSGTFRASDTFYPGRAQTVNITVHGNLSAASFGAEVAVERGRISSGTGSGLAVWSRVSTTRADSQNFSGTWAAPQISQVILRTQFSGSPVDPSTGTLVSGAAATQLGVTLATSDLLNAKDGARIIARCVSGALASGDYLYFAVEAG